MLAEQQFAQVGPRFDSVALGAGQNREQDGRPRSGLTAPQEQPVFPPDRLVAECSFADVVVDRQPTVFSVATERLPLVAGVGDGLAQHALGQRPFFQLRETCAEAIEHGHCFAPRTSRRASADNSRDRSSTSYSCRIHSKS